MDVRLAFWILLICQARAYPFMCPKVCQCQALPDAVICTDEDLVDIPDGIIPEVRILDFSNNAFVEIPAKLAEFEQLAELIFSRNKISNLEKTSLSHLPRLKELDLSYNTFTRWDDIHPHVFNLTKSLTHLNLSNNVLGNPRRADPFITTSLTTLDLSNCSIQQFDESFAQGFPNLTHLIFSNNPIITLETPMIAPQLLGLDLSNCQLKNVHEGALKQMPQLEELSLANNFDLQDFNCLSKSLRRLDLSNCVLSALPLNGLPRLVDANLSGNRLRILQDDTFAKFPNLTYLDLSRNTITSVGREAFRSLDWLKTIDLSYNPLSEMDRYTFNTNFRLLKLFLSHTYLGEVPDFDIELVEVLDLSESEISSFPKRSLRKMPFLKTLNLSRNFIPVIPDFLESESLETLNLALCRVSSVSKYTFKNLPRLRTLNLIGNRLTGSFNSSFFYNIDNLLVSDNLWRCDCNSTAFKFFHDYLRDNALDYYQLRCYYPDGARGKHWENACEAYWYDGFNDKNSTWYLGTGLGVALCIIVCVGFLAKRAYKIKEERRQAESEEFRVEARRRLLQQQLRSHEVIQSENRNAPDPRELQRPPSYDEAILLPRIDGSTTSLAGSHTGSRRDLSGSRSSLHSNGEKGKKRRKRRKPQAKSESESEPQSSSAQSTSATKRNSDSESEPSGPSPTDQRLPPQFTCYKESNI